MSDFQLYSQKASEVYELLFEVLGKIIKKHKAVSSLKFTVQGFNIFSGKSVAGLQIERD